MTTENTEETTKNTDWFKFTGEGDKDSFKGEFPDAPPWRQTSEEKKSTSENKKSTYIPDTEGKELEAVNASIYLKRPLLVTGDPGVGKSSLAHAIADEMGLELVKWEITTKTTLKDGLYSYDAIARLQDASLVKDEKDIKNINEYLFLGALGYAFTESKDEKNKYYDKPKVLLIDEIDKSDIDLPNDLLHIFEEMQFVIPELERADKDAEGIDVKTTHDKDNKITIKNGKVGLKKAKNFPIVIMTSNNNREFPPAFLRRCLSLEMKQPDRDRLIEIVEAHFDSLTDSQTKSMHKIVKIFTDKLETENNKLSVDQLLNAIQLLVKDQDGSINILTDKSLQDTIFRSLV